MQNYQEILKFWFEEIDPSMWWKKDSSFDAEIGRRFGDLHGKATRCELYTWRQNEESSLAEIILLDQFSRNIFRDTPQAFQWDPLALALAQSAIHLGYDKRLKGSRRSFLLMPFMHSESSEIHTLALNLFQGEGMEDNHKYELAHKAIIDRFGRYPHRNKILGRVSTEEELEFLKKPGSSF